MAVKTSVASTLNPDAPLFVPAAFVAAEDFSPEWWRLIQTTPAFRDYWLRERFCGMDEDVDTEEIDEVIDDYMEFEREMEEIEASSEIVHVKSENGFVAEANQLLENYVDGKDSKKGVRADPVKHFDRVPQKFVNSAKKGVHRIQQPRAM